MKKLYVSLIILTLTLLNSCGLSSWVTSSASAPESVSELRPGIHWGQSMSEVRQTEKNLSEIESYANMLLLGPVTYFDTKTAKVAYFFHQNQLAAVIYLIDDPDVKPADYLDQYSKTVRELNRKYGEQPIENINVPLNLPDTLSARVQALLDGQLLYEARWNNALTLLRLENMDDSPLLTLQFSNKALANQLRRTDSFQAAQPGFALPSGISWDMTPADVRELYKEQPMHQDQNVLLYQSRGDGFNVLTAYTFINGRLGMLDDFFILEDSSTPNYINQYEAFVAATAQIYGPSENKILRLDGRQEPAQNLAAALQKGEIAFEAVWPPDDKTMLMLLLQFDDAQNTCMLIQKRIAVKHMQYFMTTNQR